MSGSFWKFSQDYSTESPLAKILNRAFVKISDAEKKEQLNNIQKSVDSPQNRFDVLESEHEDAEEDEEDGHYDAKGHGDRVHGRGGSLEANVELPDNESEYRDYRPNLDVLEELLDDEELYTELMCSNFKLMVFFKYPEVLDRLVDYVTSERVSEEMSEPGDNEYDDTQDEHKEGRNAQDMTMHKDTPVKQSIRAVDGYTNRNDNASEAMNGAVCTLTEESEEQTESRRARMAAEILSADIWPISSTFMDHEELMCKLWSMLDHPAPLSIISSTYFMKINERLLDMDISAMIRFILDQDNLVDRFLTHIDNPPLMDFLLKVISTDKPDTPTNVIGLLKSQMLISKLLDHLSPAWSSSIQSAAGDFLKALITISANSNNEIASAIGPNELTRELVSPPIVSKLGEIMLKGGTSLSNGVGIVIELIRKNNSDYDFVQVMYTTLQTHPPNDRDPVYLGHLVKCFAEKLPQFTSMLVDTKLSPLETPFGSIEPLGFERFKICELIAELLHCSNMGLLNEPKGDEIVRERDVNREHLLKMQGYGTSKEVSNQDQQVIGSPSPEGDDLVDKVKDLKVTADFANNSENCSDRDISEEKSAESPIHQINAEIQSEEYSDLETSEQAIREKPVVGDQLKIALQDNKIITTILKMFIKYPWNNFLHNVVFDIVQQIFNGPLKTGYNRFLLADLFASAQITRAIMDGDRKCQDYERETGLRLGYMGHLTLVAEEVAKFAAYIDEMKITFSDSIISEDLNDPEWKEYTEVVLAETRGKYSSVLGDLVEEGEVEGSRRDDDRNNDRYYNGEDVYHGSYTDHEDENYAEYSDVDGSRYYEYEDESGHRIHLNHLDGDDINDLDATGEDGSGNKFGNYVSHQITKDYNATNFSSDEEEDSQWTSVATSTVGDHAVATNFQSQLPNESTMLSNQSIFHHQPFELQEEKAEDDYMDPNDDGQSYAKPNHPLYSNILSPSHPDNLYFSKQDAALGEEEAGDEEEEDDDDDSAESDEEMIVVEGKTDLEDGMEIDKNGNDYALCRTSSKGEKKWGSQKHQSNRIIGMNSTNMFNRSKDIHKNE
ncbi:SAPS family protein Ecym_6347 [Eremothecium cymbalariae DBVPG|uniref:Uncharacterized protein n=1 Tax=Eremothecium cymbalariae (strain CBS 270.75 / DBVPG 7215 / KCTC 17166 / NRRL Y-17582) TaxID=931890 RepID=G8JUE3_ERECY|nr:hypothetical protein Ecym_6347 [Eremothecium cymbalariae DBVPG\